MGWFRRRRDVAAEYQRLERQGNLAMRTGNQALLHRVQEGVLGAAKRTARASEHR